MHIVWMILTLILLIASFIAVFIAYFTRPLHFMQTCIGIAALWLSYGAMQCLLVMACVAKHAAMMMGP